MGQGIHTGGRCNLGRRGHCKLRVNNGKIRHKAGPFQEHFHIVFCIGNNGKLGSFRAGSRCGGNGHHRRQGEGDIFPHILSDPSASCREHGNGLHRIHRASSAYGDEKIASFFLILGQAGFNHLICGLTVDAVINSVRCCTAIQDIGNLFHIAQLYHHAVGDNQCLFPQAGNR